MSHPALPAAAQIYLRVRHNYQVSVLTPFTQIMNALESRIPWVVFEDIYGRKLVVRAEDIVQVVDCS